jgi:hypothetical protein
MRNLLKKLILFKLLLFLNYNAFAPVNKSVTIPGSEPINPFHNLIHAIGIVETNLDTLAYNPLEEATGYFQIRPIRLADYNKRTGNSYKLRDMYNYSIAEKIFLYYASLTGPYDFETIARSWNGSGEMTTEYWKKVQQHL